ncbi:MAG: 2,3-diaminopropionate biosynthesis protein SbnB [Catenulispora sp.]|nr:2,3-diaminopropionate biosynthesis protein SbnB [Catenulispora sp.]
MPPEPIAVPDFAVITGEQIGAVLDGAQQRVIDIVEAAYRTHGAGRTVNPPSYFLRFPDRPDSRIIALPASLGGAAPGDNPDGGTSHQNGAATGGVDGIKWVSSVPANIDSGLPRASAVVILNDPVTGYPYACLEGSIISAARTAASAALAADRLSRGRPGGRPRRVGFVGTGLIARYIHTYLVANGFDFDHIGLFDSSAGHAEGFSGHLRRTGVPAAAIRRYDQASELIAGCDLVVFATVAGAPHVHDVALFAHRPLVLHVSLRDLAPEIILSATNILDDVEHCLKADTSPHLAEKLAGNRDFVHGTLPDVLDGRVGVDHERTVVFSPFGLGVLDLAVARFVYDTLRSNGELATVDGFFHELRRHG